MKDYIEIQLRKKSQELFLLVYNKAVKIKENKGFVESFKENANLIAHSLANASGYEDRKNKMKYYQTAIRGADSLLFYNRFFYESGLMSEKRFQDIETLSRLIIDLTSALIKIENKSSFGRHNLNLSYIR